MTSGLRSLRDKALTYFEEADLPSGWVDSVFNKTESKVTPVVRPSEH